MDYYERLKPRTASSTDDYSSFYFENDHFSFPELETPPLLSESTKASSSKKEEILRQKKEISRSSLSSSRVQQQDPLLKKSTYGTTLVIGRSGTGKSSLLKVAISDLQKSKHLYLVNVRGDERAEYEKIHPGGSARVSATNLSGLPSIKSGSLVIIEDIISMKDLEQAKLREAVNYTAHHKQCKLFCVTHTVFKTGVFSLMPLFSYVIFTNSLANGPILRQTFSQFSIPKQDVERNLRLISETAESSAKREGVSASRHLYFFIECAKMTLGCFSSDRLNRKATDLGPLITENESSSPSVESIKGTSISKASSSTAAAAAAAAAAARSADVPHLLQLFFPPSHEHHKKVLGIFHLIEKSPTAKHHLRKDTLEFSFRSGNGGTKLLSLVDYLNCAWNPSATPDRPTIALHRFLTKSCRVPQSIITNRALKSTESWLRPDRTR